MTNLIKSYMLVFFAGLVLLMTVPTIPITGGNLDAEEFKDQIQMEIDFESFYSTLNLNGGENIVGLFVEEKIALEVVQQPKASQGYVTAIDGIATQFRTAKYYGSFGFLAHNFLSGENFFDLELGDEITMIDADGNELSYTVSDIRSYEALDPRSTRSDFIDLETGEHVGNLDLFHDIYESENRLVLQTCIEKDGDWEWGRLFIIAEPST